ncbi:MAG: hypothetical protein MH204_01115 [Fimbriimonadaceae bacterium]|nr:hypothetical protein [Fimbriimonadaceae bacterium]
MPELEPDMVEAISRLPEVWDTARRLGIPLTAADLRPWPESEDQNGAVGFVEAAQAWRTRRSRLGDGGRPVVERPHLSRPPADAPRPHELVEVDDPFLADLERRLGRPFFRVIRRRVTYEELGEETVELLLEASGAALWRFNESLAQGETAAALRDLQLLRQMERAAFADSLLISWTVGHAIQTRVIAAAQRMATLLQEDEAALSRLAEAMLPDSDPGDFRDSLEAEILLGVATIRNHDLYGGMKRMHEERNWGVRRFVPSLARLRLDGLPPEPEDQAYLTRYLEAWIAFSSAPPGTGPLEACRVFSNLAESLHRSPRPSYAAVADSLGDYAFAGRRWGDRLTRQKVLWAGIMVHLHRARTRRTPRSLTAAGARISDAYGRRLRFASNRQGFVVWSVGADGIDAGPVLDPYAARFSRGHDDLRLYRPIRRRKNEAGPGSSKPRPAG